MAEINPPEYFSTAASNTADMLRRVHKALRITAGVCASGDLAVAQNGTPNMSVNVAAGQAIIDGTENAVLQGSYIVTNDAVVNKAVAASDPTNPRNDLVVAKVQDAAYSGGTTAWSIAVVTGTPAGSPVDPALPLNSIPLARIRVDATVTTIVNAKITDLRVSVQGAIFPTSTGFTLWDSTGALKNMAVSDAGIVTLRNFLNIPPTPNAALPSTNAGTVSQLIDKKTGTSLSFTSIVQGFSHLRLRALVRGDTAATVVGLLARLNTDAIAANYYGEQLYGSATTPTASEFLGSAAGLNFVNVNAATAPASTFSLVEIVIPGYSSTSWFKTAYLQVTRHDSNSTGAQIVWSGMGIWLNTAAITQIDFIVAVGALHASSTAWLYGDP